MSDVAPFLADMPAVTWILVVAVGLLASVVRLILTGKLVPRSALDDAIRLADSWRRSAETWQATASEAVAQSDELREHGQLILDVLDALRRHAEAERRGDR